MSTENSNENEYADTDADIRLLLVDDEELIFTVIKTLLSGQPDINLFYCSDAAQAIKVALRIKPTVILQDLVMPDIHGLELVKQYREQSETARIPIIVLSANNDDETKGESFDAGANDYMVKLPDVIEFTARIRYHSAAYLAHKKLYSTIKRLEETQNQLLQSEKMASIGQLAAGVAHEINNPVGFVNSNVGSLKDYMRDIFSLIAAYEKLDADGATDTNDKENIQAIRKKIDWDYLKQDSENLLEECADGLQRIKKIVNDLKDFSRVDEAEWQWADIHRGIDSTINIVNNEIKYKADVVKEYGDLPSVECIPSQINQVILNMSVNAAHSIKERGVITLRTGTANGICDNPHKQTTVADEPYWVWLQISDTGEGMQPDVIQRIFDPFYTTKPIGTGTGLGLSLSYGIIHRHGGQIKVESHPGEGTTFTVWLPIKQAESKAES